MARISRSQIKKKIEELHSKDQQGQKDAKHRPDHPGQIRTPKGAKRSSTYRPKI
jgi:hypothetical protein